MSEILDIFNEKMELIGTAPRDVVHKEGYWHQTFHCWILTSHDNCNYLLVQKRAEFKKNAPNKLDISAAGHLLSGETKEDGIREVQEELGIYVDFDKMVDLGLRISASGIPGTKCNREFCHVVLLEDNTPLLDHNLQESEVSALVEIPIQEGLKLFAGEVESVKANAMCVENGKKVLKVTSVSQSDFITRIDPYYLKIFIMADLYFKGSKYLAI